MKKEDVIWHEEDEYIVMTENGWKLILVANHFKYKFWYTVEDPDGYIYEVYEKDIYKAIDKLNQLQSDFSFE